MQADAKRMSEALALARRGLGRTRPNPPVGCVVVQRGRVVGQGYHHAAGKPHAEIEALREAGARARGADVFVTLEPCSTRGRTGPCTQALIEAGVRRVVAAVKDPNPRHAGRGLRRLRAAGVTVESGLCRAEAAALIEPFATWITTGRPKLTLKLATTLDGSIADRNGQSRWISGPEARRWVDRMRSEVDAIMVGAGTAMQDDPGLLPRGRRRPTAHRVVVDSQGRLPMTTRLLCDDHADLTVMATTAACPAARCAAVAANGVDVWSLAARGGHVSLKRLLTRMGRAGWLHVLCEGGGGLAAALLRAKLVDELVMIVAPKVIGGRAAVPAFGGGGWLLKQAPRFERIEQRELGADMLLRLRPER